VAEVLSSNPRWVALQVFLKLVDHGRSLDDIFASEWFLGLPLAPRDQAMSRELSMGLCRWYFTLLPLLNQRLQKPLRARDQDIEIILLLGLYQLLVMETGSHAAVNETVKLTKLLKKNWASGLTNAVLRRVVRDDLQWQDIDRITAYPEWMQQLMREDWGDQADQVMTGGNQRPPLTLRIDTRQHSRKDYLKELESKQIEAFEHELISTAIQLKAPLDVTTLPGFEQGIVSVQDAATQIAAELLMCEPGNRVLDACAAPGGKSSHLLQRYDDIHLDALDISEKRLDRVRENLQRIGKSARLVVGDAALPEQWFDGEMYDRILIDTPCTASGVMRRHPDIKLLRRESDIISLVGQQRKILDAIWPLLKPGGMMLYSTCSIFKDENEKQVTGFLQDNADAEEIKLSSSNWGSACVHGRQILPGESDMDGFYYALLRKPDLA
jgi:16S rRNA (cytosine967-C5)-methyltransferase